MVKTERNLRIAKMQQVVESYDSTTNLISKIESHLL
jgi:hypothetical protein